LTRRRPARIFASVRRKLRFLSADVAGYRVYRWRTDSPTRGSFREVGNLTRHVPTGCIVDNLAFGVASVARDGNESVVVFPGLTGETVRG
jgi:hypothetical protein